MHRVTIRHQDAERDASTCGSMWTLANSSNPGDDVIHDHLILAKSGLGKSIEGKRRPTPSTSGCQPRCGFGAYRPSLPNLTRAFHCQPFDGCASGSPVA